MARCNCNSTCNCVVEGDNTTTTVTGTGSPSSPYVVHAKEPTVSVTDTGTVDLTLTHTGDDYNVKAAVKFSTDANQCAGLGSDGGVFVPCPDGSETIVTAGPGATVSGTGTVSDPYIVGAGATATNVVAGPDTPTFHQVVTPGPPGTFTVDGDVIISPDAGNTLAAHPNGLYVPPAAVVTGCGLETVAGKVQVDTGGTWGAGALNFPCADTSGSPVYCDSAGDLRTVPPYGGVNSGAGTVTGPTGAVPAGTTLVGATGPTAILNNPSTCRSMLFQSQNDVNARVGQGAGASVYILHEQSSVNGGPYADRAVRQFNMVAGTANSSITHEIAQSSGWGTIPPGGSRTESARFELQSVAGTPSIASSAASVSMIGFLI